MTDTVHAVGGRIVLQLWHVGRFSHNDLQPGGQALVAPSAIRPEGQTYTNDGMVDVPTPRELGTDEIPGIIADYVHAAENANAPTSTGSKCIPAIATCSTSSSATAATIAPIAMAVRSRTAPG